MSDVDRDEALDQRKRRSFLQVLFKAARLANEHALDRVRDQTGIPDIQPAHTTLFPHIDWDGKRLTTLAERLGVTKQAVKHLVDDLEEFGLVERIPDPSDGRAKLIRWTDDGTDAISDGLGLLEAIEQEFDEQLGRDAIQQSHEVLLAIVDRLEE